jgi:hypothetical protein
MFYSTYNLDLANQRHQADLARAAQIRLVRRSRWTRRGLPRHHVGTDEALLALHAVTPIPLPSLTPIEAVRAA